MYEEIIAYLRKHGSASSLDIAREFLKFKNPDEKIAHLAVKGILGKDPRFLLGDNAIWSANAPEPQTGSPLLADIPWTAVYFLTLPENPSVAAHVSLWTVAEPPELVLERWLVDPATLPWEEQQTLASVGDTAFSDESRSERILRLVAACEGATTVFLSSRQQTLFANLAAESGRAPSDEAVLASTLFSCCKRPAPRPLNLDECNKALFGGAGPDCYAYKRGERFALCCLALFDGMRRCGITGLSQLEDAEREELFAFDFSTKTFTRDDIANAPAGPGVYGFKTSDNSYLYIGKAANLRRRLSIYFRLSDESPDKLDRIRAESHSLVTYRCGSELESLIYEYRLIRKHSPLLNTQIAVGERKGDFQPLDDCVVLLPHAEEGKGTSVWFRKNQKINLRPFFSDFREGIALENELEAFFYGGSLPAVPTDFPEQEIATRWVKRRKDELCIVLANRSGSGKELWEQMRGYWKDCIGK